MEFLGARYYRWTDNKDSQLFVCRRYFPTSRSQTGYQCFNDDIRAEMKERNPETKSNTLSKLVAQAWKELSADRKAYYARKSEESRSIAIVNAKCNGRLMFRKKNRNFTLSEDRLVAFVKHSKQFGIGF